MKSSYPLVRHPSTASSVRVVHDEVVTSASNRPVAVPLDQRVSDRMRRQSRRDTAVELELRRRLHATGLRYRVHARPLPSVRRTADIVFGPARVAVFVDGCFWHGCEQHKTIPRTNREFWTAKIKGNVERDADTRQRLTEAGWLYVRVWEHDDPTRAAMVIAGAVTRRREDRRRA